VIALSIDFRRIVINRSIMTDDEKDVIKRLQPKDRS